MQIIEAAIQSSAQKSNQFIDKVNLVHFTCNRLLAMYREVIRQQTLPAKQVLHKLKQV
jgi:hypothetical protein